MEQHDAEKDCIDCQSGQFASAGARFCQTCAAGTYTHVDSTSSATTCVGCNPGKHQPTAGQFDCLDCPIGRYQDKAKLAYCLPCIPVRKHSVLLLFSLCFSRLISMMIVYSLEVPCAFFPFFLFCFLFLFTSKNHRAELKPMLDNKSAHPAMLEIFLQKLPVTARVNPAHLVSIKCCKVQCFV